jgi:predicted nucleic acid-binding protein
MAVLQEQVPLMLTPPILMEYLDVLQRPRIMHLTQLNRDQTADLVTDLVAISNQLHLRYAWRPNLQDESDNKFVEAAIAGAATIITYNLRDFERPDLPQHGWRAMTPQEFLARFLD